MSTPCTIIVPKENGNGYKYIYVHCDGTPGWAGVTLALYYDTEEKVKELISLGALSILDKEIGHQIDFDKVYTTGHGTQCVAYHRDRGEDLIIEEANTLKDAATQGYAYLWQDGKWWNCYGGRKSDLCKNKEFLSGLKREKAEIPPYMNTVPNATGTISHTAIKAVAIKFDDGTYYAGCNKSRAHTLLGAQLYKSKASAQRTIDKSVNFPLNAGRSCTIIDVELKEK